MIAHKAAFELWYNGHSQLPDGELTKIHWQLPEKEFYFYTTTQMMHDLFIENMELRRRLGIIK